MADTSKVVIIGMGDVGATIAYVLSVKGQAREMVLLNRTFEKAEGEAMDINHGLCFAKPMQVRAGRWEDCAGAHVVVVTAGAAQEPGQTRLDLARKNTRIVTDIVSRVLEHEPNPIFLIVTNPVDVITYAVRKHTGLPRERVIGAGTVLDTSRLRYQLSAHCGVDIRNVHAHVVGEHGDTETPLWSRANIGGVPLDEYCPACGRGCPMEERSAIMEEVRNAAYRIIERKGSTYYGIGQATSRILEAILKDQKSVLTVSTEVEDYYGIKDVAFSLPSILGVDGVERVLHASIADDEVEMLRASAATLRESLDAAGY